MASGTITKPELYDTLSDTVYHCIVCNSIVGCEVHGAYDKQGKYYNLYSPSSRYFCDKGVFCGADCSFKYYEEFQCSH